jgi:hypothetical protein
MDDKTLFPVMEMGFFFLKQDEMWILMAIGVLILSVT